MNRYLALLRVLIAHAKEIPAIGINIRELAVGPGWVADRIEPTSNLIELLYPIFDEVDNILATATYLSSPEIEAETASIKSQSVTLGLDWIEIVNVIVPVILQVYELLRAIRNKQLIPDARSA